MIEQSFKQVVGARYVPKFYQNSQDPSSSEWEAGKMYEPLTNVTYNMNGYCSKKPVPMSIGNPADNPEYWAKTFDYNAAYAGLQEEITAIKQGGLDDGVLAYNKLSDDAKKTLADCTKVIFSKNGVVEPVGSSGGTCNVLITKDTKKVIMVDAGRTGDWSNVRQTLIDNDVTHIDYFILSHFHADHYGNIDNLFTAGYFNNDTVAYIPRENSYVSGWNDARTTIVAKFAHVETPSYASPLVVDEFTLKFINGDASDYEYYGVTLATSWHNTYSLGVYVYAKDTILLLPADMTGTSFTHNEDIGRIKFCHIINAPHHGIEIEGNEYFAIRPEVGIISCAYGVEYKNEALTAGFKHYLLSTDTMQANSMGIPMYLTGTGDVYVGVRENGYTVIPSGREIYAYDTTTQIVYVDASYEGNGVGTESAPFTSLTQALAFAKYYKSALRINIKGTYDGSNEDINVRDIPHLITIYGEKDGDTFLSKIKSFSVAYCPRVTLNNINVHETDATTDAAVKVMYGSTLGLNGCLIDGNTTSASNYHGAGVWADYGGNVQVNDCIINDKKYAYYAGHGAYFGTLRCSGSGNNTCVCLAEAQAFIKDHTSTLTWTNVEMYLRSTGGVGVATLDNNRYYSRGLGFNAYNKEVTEETTDVINFGGAAYNHKNFLVFADTGAIYHLYKKSNGNWYGPDTVKAATHASADPNFAISLSGDNLTVTYNSGLSISAV